MASRSAATRGLALDEVLRRLDSDNDEPEEDLSDDGEDLVGDFVDESGRPGLFSSGRRGAYRDIDDECEPLSRSSDPCYNDSLLLMDSSLMAVSSTWHART